MHKLHYNLLHKHAEPPSSVYASHKCTISASVIVRIGEDEASASESVTVTVTAAAAAAAKCRCPCR